MEEKNSNKARYVVIALALCMVIGCLVVANMFLKPQLTSKQLASINKIYEVEKGENSSSSVTIQKGTVLVHYVDENGNSLKPDYVLEGNVGDEYEVQREEISKYTRSGEEPLTKAGKYELSQTEVTFVYKKAIEEVSAKAENEGKDGASENKVRVEFNNPQSQREYKLKIVTKDKKGNVINGAKFKVSKENSVLREGQVVNGDFYAGKIALDEEGKKVYEIEQTKAILGYKKIDEKINLAINTNWDERSKKFVATLDEITVEGVTATINQQDKTGEIILEVVNEKTADMYGVQVISRSGSKFLEGAKFKVTKENKVIAEGYTDNGILEVGEFEITEEGKETYQIYEEVTPQGYGRVIPEGTAGIVEVTKIFNSNTKEYSVTAKCSTIPGLSVEVSELGIVNIYVEPLGNKYDLAIRKFVSAIDGEEILGREPEVKIVEVEKENVGKVKEIQYIQNGEVEKAGNEQEVTYTLRTYNESDIAGLGNRIIEYIPDGLVFLTENEINKKYEWKMYVEDENGNLKETADVEKATVIATDYLTDKMIEGFNIQTEREPKYLDVQVVLKIDENKITSEDRIIENIVKIQEPIGKNPENGVEINTDNNVTSEKIYVKYFDLKVTKYIKEIIVNNGSKEKRYEVGEDRKSELIKIDIPNNELNKTTIKVIYGLKVTNVGEIEGYVTELMDYMPSDFELVDSGEWKMDGDKAVTAELENILLKPGESAEAEITFNWKLGKDNIGSRVNKAKILKYENPYNATMEPPVDEIKILVEIKTGGPTVVKTVAILGCCALLVIVIRKIRKNNME
ncbi:MAG: MucBP domain-containing protein [Clostridia bacterium]|nr:MucBP domain-containing protein [Clostridia bacterium]